MNMGLGLVGSPTVIFKRKFRWTMEIIVPGCGLYIAPFFCKTAARPKVSLDNIEVHFLNAITWIPGKGKWEPITVSYHDVASAQLGTTSQILSWLNTIYAFNNPVQLPMSERFGYDGVVNLMLYDGCGTPLELWQMQNVFPENIDFGDLDYESNEICSIELTLRYTNVKWTQLCGNATPIQSCCRGC